jgi:hypothetical protein
MESTRIRMVTDPSFEGLGLLSGLAQLVKESGLISTLTVGMGAMLAKQVSTYSESRLSMYHISFKSRNLPCLSIYRFLTLLANK